MLQQQGANTPERRLTRLYRSLGATDRDALLAFAEFLAQRGAADPALSAAPVAAPQEPGPLNRPPAESVVAAIRRLRYAYPMLEHGDLLHQASALMSGHVLQGRPAAEVVDDLEALFARHYSAYRDGRQA